MTAINTVSTGRGSKTEFYLDGTMIQFHCFPTDTARDRTRLARVERAFRIVDRLDRRMDPRAPCNLHFQGLPSRRSFRDVWRDPAVFINLSPSTRVGFYGAMHSGREDICVSAWCIDTGNPWMIAATIVHELAHVAGAPGEPSRDAERTVLECGFGPQYDPSIVGSIQDLGRTLERLG